MKKAIVFDNSGTLLERYRVIKDVSTGELFTDVNSLHLIDSMDSLALVVLQFNTNCLLNLDSNTLISDVIKQHKILILMLALQAVKLLKRKLVIF